MDKLYTARSGRVRRGISYGLVLTDSPDPAVSGQF